MIGNLLRDYLRQNTSDDEVVKKIEHLGLSPELQKLILTVKDAIAEAVGKHNDKEIEIDDILLYLTHSSVDVYVQTSKKVSEILGIDGINNYQKEFDKLDENGIEVKFLWDVEEGWKVKRVSKNLESVLGYLPRDFYLGSLTYTEIIYEEDLDRVQQEVSKCLTEKKTEYIQEYRVKKKDGTIITILDKTYVQYDEKGHPIYIYGYVYNIDDTKNLERKIGDLQSELEIDLKTGEKSHSKLISDLKTYCLSEKTITSRLNGIPILSETCKERNCSRCNFTILKITNYDRLLSFVDTEEEKVELSKSIIKIIKSRFDKNISFYVISDGKYGIISPSKVHPQTVQFNEHAVIIGEQSFGLNVIFGGVTGLTGKTSGLEVYKQANLIMKHQILSSKEDFYYTPQLEKEIKEQELKSQRLDNTITTCLETDGFVPYYQGIRDNRTGNITKFEVLGRVHVEDKNYSIHEYLERLSETSKLIIVMKKIIDKVIEELIKNTEIDVSFNFSQSELNNDFLNRFVDELDKANIKHSRITIEVLETTNSKEDIGEIIQEAKKLGFKIAIDDFGTGYSNIQRLLQINPNYLKIDGSLIHGLSKNKKQLDVVRAFLEIAKILQADVVAEKIEEPEDQQILEILGVRYTQGYLFSKPRPSF